MTISVLKTVLRNERHRTIIYRNYKKLDIINFRYDVEHTLNNIPEESVNYENFEKVIMEKLEKHAAMKRKIVRANNAHFMNKVLSKAVMNRSRLRNKFTKDPTIDNEKSNKKQRNYCVNLFKKEKKEFFRKH